MVVQTLVQNHLFLRGGTYYFRYVLPAHIRCQCPSLPIEIKRSLRTDSYSSASSLVRAKLPQIKLIRDCNDAATIESLYQNISNFSQDRMFNVRGKVGKKVVGSPRLLSIWVSFKRWKSWSDKQAKDNQRMFDNLIYFIGDVPVLEVTKQNIRGALTSISKLPKRNKKAYRGVPIGELVKLRIPIDELVSDKYVKDHLKLCQSLFSRYMKYELDILKTSPTEGLRYEYVSVRYASLNDEQIRTVLSKSQDKPDWFAWFMLLSVYSGARRSELINLNKSDFKYCDDSKRHYFHVRKGKTAAAVRIIPIHYQLICMGLLEWVGSRSEEALFNVTPNRVTDIFNSLFKERKNDLGERIVLHSVRHTFITKARSAGVSNVLVQQVVGHEKSGAGQTDRYTHTFHLRDVLTVVDSINFEAL